MRFDKDLIICHYKTSWWSIILNPSDMTSHQSSFIFVMDRLSLGFLQMNSKNIEKNRSQILKHGNCSTKNCGKKTSHVNKRFSFFKGRFSIGEVSEIYSNPSDLKCSGVHPRTFFLSCKNERTQKMGRMHGIVASTYRSMFRAEKIMVHIW